MAEWLQFPIRFHEAKSGEDPGVMEGYASVFNVVDDQDEIVVPGAFKRTLANLKKSGRRIPLTADHEMTGDGVIGSADVAEEDHYGLKVRFAFSADPRAQALRAKAREGHMTGMSIFGEVVHKSFRQIAGRQVRILEEVKLMAVGLTPWPANGLSLGTAKSDADGSDQAASLDESWASDMRAALDISAPFVRKTAVDQLVAAYTAKSSTEDHGAEDDDATSEDTENEDGDDVAAKYALAVIGESGSGDSPPGGNPSDDSLADLLAPLQIAGNTSELDALEAELKQMGLGQ